MPFNTRRRFWNVGNKLRIRVNKEIVMEENKDNIAYLKPDEANLHMFRALTACAVLDVLAPPYNLSEGRDCTYFCPVEGFSVNSNDWDSI